MKNQPFVSVGIMHEKVIEFSFVGHYYMAGNFDVAYDGDRRIEITDDGRLLFEGNVFKELIFQYKEAEGEIGKDYGAFWLKGVTIGVNFHWERKEDQKFMGNLRFIVEDGKVCAVNLIGVEDYLKSVISSEMSATASMELLKAHAVISRSWLLAQIEKGKEIRREDKAKKISSCILTDEELTKWYDREDHKRFDVCADDHCQRYQGLTKETSANVVTAVDDTWGEVLDYEGKICDARFYKCCGGVTDVFENTWEPKHYDYLLPVRDDAEAVENERKGNGQDAVSSLNLENEDEAEKWIMSTPDSFCNTDDKKVLSEVLNDYDRETVDFYRWKVEYSQKELAEIVKERSGCDYGDIVDLVPLSRSASARIYRLKFIGTKKTLIIGKELEIRKTLSKSHLYSSAFVVKRYNAAGEEMKKDDGSVPAKFVFYGAGWGHGVGLCQIGAAVMGAKGYGYGRILNHYYPNSKLVKKY